MEQPTYHYARENPPCPVPSLDGYVIVESSDVPVPYHITSCGAGSINAAQGHSLAVSSARIACMSADIMRGQLHAGKLRRAVTGPCLKKLETMAYLLDNHMQSNPELKAKLPVSAGGAPDDVGDVHQSDDVRDIDASDHRRAELLVEHRAAPDGMPLAVHDDGHRVIHAAQAG